MHGNIELQRLTRYRGILHRRDNVLEEWHVDNHASIAGPWPDVRYRQ